LQLGTHRGDVSVAEKLVHTAANNLQPIGAESVNCRFTRLSNRGRTGADTSQLQHGPGRPSEGEPATVTSSCRTRSENGAFQINHLSLVFSTSSSGRPAAPHAACAHWLRARCLPRKADAGVSSEGLRHATVPLANCPVPLRQVCAPCRTHLQR